MESIGRRSTATSTNVTSAVVGLLLSPSRPSVTTVTSNTKTAGLCHVANSRVPLQHPGNGNVISHEQYAPIFQEHGGQLIASPAVPAVSTSPIIMPPSNIATVGMELSPFGILPHERVVPQHAHHRQPRKFPVCPQFTKTPMDTDYEPRTTSQPVGYLSVITRTTNSVTMDNMATNNNYYQTQPLPLPLQTKTSDNHDRQYYHFENAVPANQTPQHQLDNILLMGAPVQRGDPMHIVKNLQSMQTDIDCYGVKKMIEQQPRIISTDIGKSIGPPTLLNNISGKRIIENQQLPKSVMINSSYNGQYFRRQPPPAHIYPHHGQTNLQQNIMIGNTYLDVHRHPNWNLDHQKPHTTSTTSCFTGNSSPGVFHQSILQQSQPYNNTVSTFNIQPPVSTIPQLQQMPVPTHNNFIVSTVSPTYYVQTPSTVSPMTLVTTSSPSIFNRQHHNTEPQNPEFQDFTNNIQSTNYAVNENNRPPYTPHVVVPNIEEELSHLCDETMSTTNAIVKPLNVKPKQPSFIDSYIKFLNGDVGSVSKPEIENNEKSKKLMHPLSSSTPKPLPKPYIPISKPKIVVPANEQTSSRSNEEDNKKTTNTTTLDEDPRYFPLPKTSSAILDEKSAGSNHENSWSGDQEQDQWWMASSLEIKKKINVNNNKKKKNNSTQKKKTLNSNTAVKKQKTQHLQPPKRQLSHRLAKEKTQKLLSSLNGELDIEDDSSSNTDSDVDPAWIPDTEDNDVTKSSISGRQRHVNNNKYSKDQNSIGESLPTTSSLSNNNNDKFDDSTVVPFKSGTFVALHNEFLDNEQIQGDIPQHLWRVDGKSLLQKFQRCNDSDMFKSVSTYTGWGPPHYHMYRQVSVQFITKDKNATFIPNKSSTDIFVKLLCDNSNKFVQNNSKVNAKCPTDNQISKPKVDTLKSISSMNTNDQNKLLRANFDVYVQTLASQALDSNFLGEIYRENDEFFLSNVRAIEKVTQTWLEAMDALIRESAKKLPKVNNVRTIVARYPELEICSMGEISVNNIPLQCIVCGYEEFVGKYKKFNEVSLSGREYNSRTLKISTEIQSIQKLQCCSIQCSDKLTILHSLEHLKYNIYKECCKRITAANDDSSVEITTKDTQDTTAILNRLLADDEWIEKLFHIMSNTWSRAKKFVSNNQSNSGFSS
ncbi:Hypothetical protein CINCED_3A000178 [Cinara cedri]|uniref:DUF4211 domain-containing protein n=1 Tax=Cinara cedri TaxID=506608 RepID=A0A5E4NGB7_9HEMI|nr:Hypothetical protein CINCED_3A000178 [Cinara cedri]